MEIYSIFLGAHAAEIDSILITRWGVHAAELHNDLDNLNTKGIISSGNSFDRETTVDCYFDNQISQKSLLLKNVITLSDNERIKRPYFVMEELKW
jgi:hypothetical protein